MGKTYILEQVAKALGLGFHTISGCNQMTKTDLMGFIDAQGIYRWGILPKTMRDGGIFLIDEIDATNSNTLVILNSALSNGFIECPNGEMIYSHKDFRFCATANTLGRGATSKYVGRNKLDSATLDRFAVLNFELDEDVELMMCGNDEVFHKAILSMRKEASKSYEDFMVSQRSSSRLYNLVTNGFSVTEALEIAVFKGCDEDIVKSLTKKFMSVGWTQPSTGTGTEEEPKSEEAEYEAKMEEAEEEVESYESPESDDMDDDDSNFNW